MATVVPIAAAWERRTSGVAFEPLAPGFHQDPYASYARLRGRSPVHRSVLTGGWVLSRYEDVRAAMRDRRLSQDPRRRPWHRRIGRRRAFTLTRAPMLPRLDPPEHARVRGRIAYAFSPAAATALRPRVAAVADELLDRLDGRQRFDLVEAFAAPLPLLVILECLGIPPNDARGIEGWCAAIARNLEPTRTEFDYGRAVRASSALRSYLEEHIAALPASADPHCSPVHALLAPDETGARLTAEEVVGTIGFLILAGMETTRNFVATTMLVLLRDPAQLERLRERRELLPAAVQELLRYESPLQLDVRYALEDVQIGEHRVKRGQQLTLLLGSANRDESVFCDPDQLDIGRDGPDHLAFGSGPHYCLGSHLAVVMAEVALDRLLDRFPSMRLASPVPVFEDQVLLRRVASLEVEVP